MSKKFTSFTGETIESALLSDDGPETWYDCLHAHQKTPEGKRGLWKNGIDWHYGITPDDYTKLFNSQYGLCAICSKPPKYRRLGIDHNHNTNKIRGLLCNNCNSAIGLLKESTELLNRAKEYLIKEGIHKSYNKLLERREAYNILFEVQQGKCVICSYHKKLIIDHNHVSGEVRGLLCNNCNWALGLLNESVELFDKAKEYLVRKNN